MTSPPVLIVNFPLPPLVLMRPREADKDRTRTIGDVPSCPKGAKVQKSTGTRAIGDVPSCPKGAKVQKIPGQGRSVTSPPVLRSCASKNVPEHGRSVSVYYRDKGAPR